MPPGELTVPQAAFYFFETLLERGVFLDFNSMTSAFSRETSHFILSYFKIRLNHTSSLRERDFVS